MLLPIKYATVRINSNVSIYILSVICLNATIDTTNASVWMSCKRQRMSDGNVYLVLHNPPPPPPSADVRRTIPEWRRWICHWPNGMDAQVQRAAIEASPAFDTSRSAWQSIALTNTPKCRIISHCWRWVLVTNLRWHRTVSVMFDVWKYIWYLHKHSNVCVSNIWDDCPNNLRQMCGYCNSRSTHFPAFPQRSMRSTFGTSSRKGSVIWLNA